VSGQEAADELIRNADVAMYMRRRKARRASSTSRPRWRNAAIERMELEHDLRSALEEKHSCCIRAVIMLESGRFTASRRCALNHPRRGLLAPADFIGVAEQKRADRRAGALGAATGARDGRRWQVRYRPCLR